MKGCRGEEVSGFGRRISEKEVKSSSQKEEMSLSSLHNYPFHFLISLPYWTVFL